MTYISLILAIMIVKLVLPEYSNWLGRDLSFNLISNLWLIPGLLLFGCIVGILAGIYPAFFLSSFSPPRVLKAQAISETNNKGISLRSLLVVAQFSASVFLIIGTLIISKQMSFIQNKDVGFIRQNIIILRSSSSFARVSHVFMNEIRQHTGVMGVTASSSLPGFFFSNLGFGTEGKWFTLNIISCDTGFQRTVGLRIVQGYFFSSEFPTDSSGIILNETAVRILGLKIRSV